MDLVVLVAAFFAAVLLRFEFTFPGWFLTNLATWLPIVVGATGGATILAKGHLHAWRHAGLRQITSLAIAVGTAAAGLLGLWYLAAEIPLLASWTNFHRLSRAVIVLHAVLGLAGLATARLTTRLVHDHRQQAAWERRGLRSRRVLILGAGRTGVATAGQLELHPELALEPIGFIDPRPDVQGQILEGLPVLGTPDDLREVATHHQPDVALLAVDEHRQRLREHMECRAADIGLRLRTIPSFPEFLRYSVATEPPETGTSIDVQPPGTHPLKRAVDVGVGGLLSILATPVIVVLAAGAAACLRTWPLFVQDRIGLAGRRFRFPKIRTLPPQVARYGLEDAVRDTAIPPFCRWLRRRHLDELPQLYLVPFGVMSLVGPRPKMPDDVEPADQHYRTVRTLVPQGCTCLWQIGLHTDGRPSETPEYDYWYLRHASIRMDLWILWRTALQMMGLAAPLGLADVPEQVKGPGWIDERLVVPELSVTDDRVTEGDRALASTG